MPTRSTSRPVTIPADGPASEVRLSTASAKRRRLWFTADPSREALVTAIRERAAADRFMSAMADGLARWGHLLPNQEAAVRRSLAAEPARAARREERRARDADSAFVGEVGVRREFELRVDGVFTSVTDTCTYHTHVMRDGDGNVVTYRGNLLGVHFEKENGGFMVPFERESRVVLKATVKRHEEYDGTKRTVLQRPTVVEAPPARVSELPFERHLEQTDWKVRFPTWGWHHKEAVHARRSDGRIVPWTSSHEGDALLLPSEAVERVEGTSRPLDTETERMLAGLVLD